ncbi:histidine--tRNA ligase [Candidatus Woesearchaeota archaeon B3_Woes]|nr:MAG: histidine--tRNA ligase [Candidatus Woesearchaeota archaeon B3_Woes]
MVMQTMQIRLTNGLINEIKILVDLGIYPNVSEAVRDSVRMLVTSKETPKGIPPAREEEIKTIQEKIQKEVKEQFQNPKGTEDYYPEEMSIRNKVFDVLRKNALKFGFLEVDSPVIEDLDLLKAKQGDEIIKQIFITEKKGDEELALRAEFTPSLARMFIAKQKAIPKPVKWFCINRVFRYEKPQAGRQREFFQFNVEIYGCSKPEADAEIINLSIESLKSLGLNEKDFFVKINNRKLIQGLLSEIVEEKQLEDVMRIIDKRKKISEDEFNSELEKIDITLDQIKKIKIFLDSKINNLNPKNELAKQGLKELKEILKLVDKKFIKVDFSVVRGLAYYTGTVFEISDTKEKFRSIAGGGRYDNMIELFKGDKTPSTGFGMGYSTLRLLLKEKGLLPKEDIGVDYYIAIVNKDVKEKAFEIAFNLRKKYRVDIDLMQRNLGNQFDYANKIKAKNVIVIGPDELKKGKIKIKNMKSGKEAEKAIEDINV